MKVALLGVKGEFGESHGKGVQRYMHEMYVRLRQMPQLEVKKVEYAPLPVFGVGLSFMFHNMFQDLSGFDIVHNPDIKPFYKLGKPWRIRITTAHEFRPLLHPELMFNSKSSIKDRIWLNVVTKLAFKSLLKSDYLTANSSQTKEEAVSLGFDKDRIFVVNHGIDKKFTTRALPNKKDRKGFKIGYIGSLSLGKNVGMAVDAVKLIKGKNTSFEIWGEGPERSSIAAKISGDRRISLMGFVPESTIIQRYESFDAFVAPSLYEGFGLPILEAQSRGLPVVIYKKGKIPDEVRRYCFEAKDAEDMAAIIQRLKDNGYDARQRKKAALYAQGFTWEKTAKGTAEVYTKVASRA
jgi:glycosyltransferase involved in cell wall biosynthesis